MFAGTPPHNEIFAANRAIGRLALAVTAAAARSWPERLHEAGALRLRFPNTAASAALEGVIVNTAGGMTGGDRFDIDIAVRSGAALTVTTAAAEKIYRSLGPTAQISVRLDVCPGAALVWLPQETILFDRARLRRTIEVDVAPEAKLTLAEAVIFGRSAMGEVVREGQLFDRWRVRIGGALAFAESLRIDGAIAEKLARRAIAGNNIAIASVLKIPGDPAAVAALRAVADDCGAEVGASTWNGLMLVRVVAPSGAALRRNLIAVAMALGLKPLPRLWAN